MVKRSIIFVLIIICLSVMPAMAAETTQKNNSDESHNLTNAYYKVIYNRCLKVTPSLGADWADWITRSVIYHSQQYGVHPLLTAALLEQESGYNVFTNASSAGARGIAQLMPDTAAKLGVQIDDPAQNLEGGIRYLAEQLYRFRNNGEWSASYAVAAYNAGPGAVQKYGGIPPYEETINYVISVGAIFERLNNEVYRYMSG